jgi:hypothetical protein
MTEQNQKQQGKTLWNIAGQLRGVFCLFSLDIFIAAESEKFDALKTHNKGLIQQLFPAMAKDKDA